MLNITNLLFVIFVILKSKKDFHLKQKFEVVKILEDFVIFIQRQSETTLIRSDNENEFFMTNFLSIKK